MKIVQLTAENFKRLKAVSITPDGNIVQITGKNGAGKTSVLDALWAALAGASVIPSEPVRAGEDTARIRLDLGELVVTRTFKKDEAGETTTNITVQNTEGARYPSPQRMLDDLMGALTFDPLEFARMDAREQFDALKRFVPGVDFDDLEEQNKLDYSKRTDINRRAKEARAQAAGIVIEPVVAEEKDEGALVDELRAAMMENARLDQRAAEFRSIEETVRRMDGQVVQLRQQAEKLEAEARDIWNRAKQDYRTEMGSNPDPRQDVDAIRGRIARAHAAEAQRGKVAEHNRLVMLGSDLEHESEAITKRMQAREQAKRDAIAAAQMPLTGLDLATDEVRLNGVPFDQASDAEKLRASVAIAMAGNPKLRVIRIRDGSLLDSASLALIASMAAETDMQVWIERVDETGTVGFVIEDGHLKED